MSLPIRALIFLLIWLMTFQRLTAQIKPNNKTIIISDAIDTLLNLPELTTKKETFFDLIGLKSSTVATIIVNTLLSQLITFFWTYALIEYILPLFSGKKHNLKDSANETVFQYENREYSWIMLLVLIIIFNLIVIIYVSYSSLFDVVLEDDKKKINQKKRNK